MPVHCWPIPRRDGRPCVARSCRVPAGRATKLRPPGAVIRTGAMDHWTGRRAVFHWRMSHFPAIPTMRAVCRWCLASWQLGIKKHPGASSNRGVHRIDQRRGGNARAPKPALRPVADRMRIRDRHDRTGSRRSPPGHRPDRSDRSVPLRRCVRIRRWSGLQLR